MTNQIPIFAVKCVEIKAWSPHPDSQPPDRLHIRLDSVVFNRNIGVLLVVRTPGALDRLIARLQALRKEIWGSVQAAGATQKPGWKLPMAPAPICPECQGKIVPCVVDTGDGWAPFWDCENSCEPFTNIPGGGVITGEDAWPFVEDFARSSDWIRAGFKVV